MVLAVCCIEGRKQWTPSPAWKNLFQRGKSFSHRGWRLFTGNSETLVMLFHHAALWFKSTHFMSQSSNVRRLRQVFWSYKHKYLSSTWLVYENINSNTAAAMWNTSFYWPASQLDMLSTTHSLLIHHRHHGGGRPQRLEKLTTSTLELIEILMKKKRGIQKFSYSLLGILFKWCKLLLCYTVSFDYRSISEKQTATFHLRTSFNISHGSKRQKTRFVSQENFKKLRRFIGGYIWAPQGIILWQLYKHK